MAKSDEAHIIIDGRCFVIEFAVLDDGSMPASNYFTSLHIRDQANLKAYFQHLADAGSIENKPSKFKHEDGAIWAFKRKGLNGRRIRIPCYRDGKRWILTHGFDKPAQRLWPPEEIPTANSIREQQQQRERIRKGKAE